MSNLTPTQFVKRIAKRHGIKIPKTVVNTPAGPYLQDEANNIANKLMQGSSPLNKVTPDKVLAELNN
jgi:hypothetical protein